MVSMTITRTAFKGAFILALLLPLLSFAETSVVSTSTEPASETQPWYKTERLIGTVDTGDFVVGPGRSELDLAPGETQIVMISVANRISDDRTFKLEVVDISGTTNGSSALQVFEGERGPYSIQDYISIQEDTITLALGERARIPVVVSIPADAEPGGFYGSILVSTIQPGSAPSDPAPRNPIIARVGSHIFLNIAGDKEISGKTLGITTLPSAAWYVQGPITFGIAYENTGSLHLNPYGQVSIKNILGDEVGFTEIEPWFVLPGSVRTREVEWNREFLFGRYTAVVTMNRGYEDVLDEVTVTFWVLPYKLIAGLFGGLFLMFFLIRLFTRTFEFKRK